MEIIEYSGGSISYTAKSTTAMGILGNIEHDVRGNCSRTKANLSGDGVNQVNYVSADGP